MVSEITGLTPQPDKCPYFASFSDLLGIVFKKLPPKRQEKSNDPEIQSTLAILVSWQ